ncbi:hypothetical protein FRC02_003168 [Tulasnella sp. 418]|nr:hypothetical protein FRC02_003168 [Tulasnella sp. 418]
MSQSNQVGQSSATTKNASSSSNSRRRKPDYEGLLHPSPGNDSVANRLINAGYVVVRSPLPLSLNHQVEESEEDPRQGQVHNNILKHTAPCSSDASPLLLFSGAPLFIPQGSSSYPCWSSLYRIEISPELLKLVDDSMKSNYRLKGPGGPKVVKHIFDYMMTVQCGHRRNSSSTSLAIYFDSDRIYRSSRRLVNAPLSMHAAICGHKTSTVLSTWDMSREDEWDIIFQASHPDPSQRFGCYSRLHGTHTCSEIKQQAPDSCIQIMKRG